VQSTIQIFVPTIVEISNCNPENVMSLSHSKENMFVNT
jgi:hypothetical protein